MPESHQEQVSRVEMMAEGHDTWDLSDNDTAALKTVLGDRKLILDALDFAIAYIKPNAAAGGVVMRRLQDAVRKATGATR